ncbi:MAG: hypothetical protein WAK60_12220 [Sedimentisphaerales bacterium]
MNSEEKVDICKSCGRTIGASEGAIVVKGGLICFQCEQKLPHECSNQIEKQENECNLQSNINLDNYVTPFVNWRSTVVFGKYQKLDMDDFHIAEQRRIEKMRTNAQVM